MSGRALLPLLLLLAACEDREPMTLQARDDPYRPSDFFEDGRAMRPRVAGTVSQEGYRHAAGLPPTGTPDAGYPAALPLPLTRALMQEGRSRYEVYCAACHGLLADGQSVVAQKMALRRPPALVGPGAQRGPPDGGAGGPGALAHPPGYYFAVMTEGYGLMPSYAETLAPRERWAVVAYLQALALSQAAPLALAPPDVQARLREEAP